MGTRGKDEKTKGQPPQGVEMTNVKAQSSKFKSNLKAK